MAENPLKTPVRISDHGRKALASGLIDRKLDPRGVLIIEVASRLDRKVSTAHFLELVMDLIDKFGSAQAAITELRCGRVTFEREGGFDA